MKYIMHDRNALMAHIYVLHMGDPSGGQMIAKKVPTGTKVIVNLTQINKNLKMQLEKKPTTKWPKKQNMFLLLQPICLRN